MFTCRKDVRLPVQLQRAMAAEAEAAREARAKVIAAEGEQNARIQIEESILSKNTKTIPKTTKQNKKQQNN